MLEPLIVADSSPLIGLARIEQLHIVQKLARTVVIPQAVWQEIVVQGKDYPGAEKIRQAGWITVRNVDPANVAFIESLVDRGEAEAIALAQQEPGCLLLLDDSHARRIAERLGVRRIGTVGLLRRAKHAGFIALLKPHLLALQENSIYISQHLIDEVLKDVGEAP